MDSSSDAQGPADSSLTQDSRLDLAPVLSSLGQLTQLECLSLACNSLGQYRASVPGAQQAQQGHEQAQPHAPVLAQAQQQVQAQVQAEAQVQVQVLGQGQGQQGAQQAQQAVVAELQPPPQHQGQHQHQDLQDALGVLHALHQELDIIAAAVQVLAAHEAQPQAPAGAVQQAQQQAQAQHQAQPQPAQALAGPPIAAPLAPPLQVQQHAPGAALPPPLPSAGQQTVGTVTRHQMVMSHTYRANSLGGLGVLRSLTRLTSLDLSGNSLEQVGSQIAPSEPMLLHICLHTMRYMCSLPPYLSDWRSQSMAETLRLLTQTSALRRLQVPDLSTLSLLITLNLSGNQLASLPACLPQLSRLETLNVQGNCLYRITDNELYCLSCLRQLNLGANRLETLPDGEQGRAAERGAASFDSFP